MRFRTHTLLLGSLLLALPACDTEPEAGPVPEGVALEPEDEIEHAGGISEAGNVTVDPGQEAIGDTTAGLDVDAGETSP